MSKFESDEAESLAVMDYVLGTLTDDEEPVSNRLSARAKQKLANNARKTIPGPNKIDPTRTTNIRSSFIKKLRAKFALLRGKVWNLVVTEDAFGLQAGNDLKLATNIDVQNWCNQYGGDTCLSPGGDEGVEPKEREDREIHHLGVNRVVQDAAKKWKYKGEITVLDQNGPLFERGGVQWREGGNCHLDSGKITIHSGTAGESVEAIQKLTAHEMMHGTFEKVYRQYDADMRQLSSQDIKASGQLKPGKESEFPTYARLWHFREEVPLEQFIKDDGVSDYSRAYWKDFADGKVTSHIAIHETLAEIAGQHEATGVLVGSKLYRDYYKAVRDEYRVLTGTQRARRGVGVTKNEAEHVIYLNSNLQPTSSSEAVYVRLWANGVSTWGIRSSTSPTANRYQFKTSPQKIEEFQKWLRQQFRSTITGMSDEQLWKEFAKQGYLKGAGRAFDDVQGPRRTRRFSPGEGDFYQGSRAEFLRSSFARPETVEKIQLLAGRSFDDLENVTSDMATRMSRTLTDGLSQGMNPREVAELLDDDLKLGGNRAEVIARTEIIRAHAEGQLDSMKAMGVQTVGAEVEWSTAGDLRVCPECSEMEGKIYSIEDARGLIPMHPQCRCAWLPAGFDKLMSEGGDE